MEWVETTGRSIDEAKETALDRLGVDETEAEFEVIDEPRFGLFGRLRSEARVRARVRPTAPRPKQDRRDRRRRRRVEGLEPVDAGGGSSGGGVLVSQSSGNEKAARSPDAINGLGTQDQAAVTRGRPQDRRDGGVGMNVPLDEQGEVARQFLDGLVDEMDLDADVRVARPDDDTVELHLEGNDLGLLIGAKGVTLLALQDLTRTVVQRRTSAANGRILVDVSGYRRKRKEALERFTRQLAEEVRRSGTRKVLEPMSAADRKIVHDSVNELEGVMTTSEGEEPRRRVVILPQQPR